MFETESKLVTNAGYELEYQDDTYVDFYAYPSLNLPTACGLPVACISYQKESNTWCGAIELRSDDDSERCVYFDESPTVASIIDEMRSVMELLGFVVNETRKEERNA